METRVLTKPAAPVMMTVRPGVGATVSRASDVALPVGAERSARVGARRRREKGKEAERRERKNVKNGEQLETSERKKLIE